MTISKILVNRFLSLLDKLISPLQSAFIPRRSIHDNILLTHEIMHKFKKAKGKTAWVALKLDMEKAYDRLEWDYIKKCLELYGFHSAWIKWIMECITSVSYSLLINDEPSGLIKPSRGIDQFTQYRIIKPKSRSRHQALCGIKIHSLFNVC